MRPGDHADAVDVFPQITQPSLGPIGWLRWAWRQLASMRTALVLLLLLAIAAVPGSLFPQRSADPNGVIQWRTDNPDAFPTVDALGLFDVYTSPWFSAIYLLLFTSLIGCIIPRTLHHAKALRGTPPRTPVRLSRLAHHDSRQLTIDDAGRAEQAAGEAIGAAAKQLRRNGYRVARYDTGRTYSVSAERGYLRETGNLVFHASLVGVLVAVGVGGGFGYTGQRVIVEGTTFLNALGDYSSFNPGRFVDGSDLTPYAVTLDDFQVRYQAAGEPGAGQAGDFVADLSVRAPDGTNQQQQVRVNHPLRIGDDNIFLLGNGYAPTITIRNPDGETVYRESQPFLPQDATMTSLGVVKVADGLPEQIGLIGFLYPTQQELTSGAYTSVFPDLIYPVVTFNVFVGSLGIDDGTPRSVYTLEVGEMTQLTGGDTGVDSIELRPGETADLPNGWGTITFENESATGDVGDSVKRFASLQIQRDPSGIWVLAFSLLALAGLLTALFVPRRRVWVKATPSGKHVNFEYAALARGEDPTLGKALALVVDRHLTALRVRTEPVNEKE
ncbi:cytochrome c biogenesis protein [Microbacterium invictum]|uniref:Cytochrome c biogenesis protein n=1 Tax=Microbacterium invictum TaxID=515415 RepID=A0AA40SQQ7_9MICO|nr:cytochrome c biogenesis protein ResB [Microbacterium invictum]MBB4140653.1 cytochrome c biogenesis protein [Microbacterium invictum]